MGWLDDLSEALDHLEEAKDDITDHVGGITSLASQATRAKRQVDELRADAEVGRRPGALGLAWRAWKALG